MNDLTNLSDDELMAIVGGKGQASSSVDYSKMSDQDLMAAIGQSAQPKKNKYPDTFGGNVAQAVEDYVPQGVRDVSRAFRSGVTLGASDVLPGMFGGRPAKELQAETEAAIDRHPVTGEIAKIGGMMAPLALTGGVVGAGAGALRSVPLLGRVAASPIAQAAATGAIAGGSEAGIKGDDIGTGAALGGIFGAGGQALGQAVGGAIKGAGDLTRKTVGPTSDALMAEKNLAYDAVKNSGTTFPQQSIVDLGNRLVQTYNDFGFSKHVNPKGVGPLKQFGDMAKAGAVSPQDVDNLLKTAGNLTQSIDKSDRTLGHKIRSTIVDWMQQSSPQDAGELLKARSLAAKTIKDRQIQEALQKAETRAMTSGTGGNIENTRRQEIAKLLKGQGWTPDERAAIEGIAGGTPVTNMVRRLGRMSPETGVLPAMAHLGGGMSSGGSTIPLTLASILAKHGGEAVTQRKIGLLADLVRSGGQLPAPNALQRLGPAISPIIGRGLLAAGLGGI